MHLSSYNSQFVLTFRIPDANILDDVELTKDFSQVEIDTISWKTAVQSSLRKMYGLLGEASHFDILRNKNKKAIIRIQYQDLEKFRNSLMSFTFRLNTLMGSSISSGDINCYIKVNGSGDYLGLLMDDDFDENE